MIERAEIETKALEFGIHVANVQRDYVFGWFLAGLYTESVLGESLILKGGNCFRKAYFPNTRFSADLDFSTTSNVDEPLIVAQFNAVCQFVQNRTGITFDLKRSQIRVQGRIDKSRRVFDVRVYFKTSMAIQITFGFASVSTLPSSTASISLFSRAI